MASSPDSASVELMRNYLLCFHCLLNCLRLKPTFKDSYISVIHGW